MKFVNSLQFRLVVLILIAIVPVCSLLAWQYVREVDRRVTTTLNEAIGIVASAATNTDMLLENSHRVLVTLSKSNEYNNSEYLERVRAGLPRPPLNLAYVDGAGVVVASAVPLNGRVINMKHQQWWTDAKSDTLNTGGVEVDPITQEKSVTISLRTAKGYLISVRGLNYFGACIQHGNLRHELLVLDRYGIRLARNPSWEKAIGTKARSWPNPAGSNQWFESTGSDDVLRKYYYMPVASSKGELVVGVGVSIERLTRDTRQAFYTNFLWLVISASVSFFAAWLLARRTILTSVRWLISQSAKLAEGDWDAYNPDAYPNWNHEAEELHDLINFFHKMAQKLATGFDHLDTTIRTRTAELDEANTELARSNEELEKFAYVASHDLKAPLRAVVNLASWMVEDLKEGKDVSEYANLLTSRVKRMENLINALLEYSRVGRFHTELEDVDVLHLLLEIGNELQCQTRLVLAGNLPTVKANKVRLEQVFSNLICNALKFNTNVDAQVLVSFERSGSEYIFCVQDNGPGIDPQFHDRIFEIFQTLQPKDEYESTGIGLAIVKKIVEDNGGAIWLESELGQGCKFYFTIPVQPS